MVKILLLPPAVILVAGLIALVLFRRRPAVVWYGAVITLAVLYVFSTPLAAALLMRPLESFPALGALPAEAPGAIVILSADRDAGPEYGEETVGGLTLVRVRYGAALYRRTHLPVLVSGGRFPRTVLSLAESMRRVLTREYGVPEVWVEDRSGTTWENAVDSAAILKAKGITRVYLVTHAWHMARARKAFLRAGIAVVPAPTGFVGWEPPTAESFLPSAKAALTTYYAIHEWIGGVVYDLRYGSW